MAAESLFLTLFMGPAVERRDRSLVRLGS
jgi:hypothetical protein